MRLLYLVLLSAFGFLAQYCAAPSGGTGIAQNSGSPDLSIPEGATTSSINMSMFSSGSALTKSGSLSSSGENFYIYCPGAYSDGSAWYQTVTSTSSNTIQIITANPQGTAVTCQIAFQVVVESGDSFAGTYTTTASGASCGSGGSAPSSSCLVVSFPSTGCTSNACITSAQPYTFSGGGTDYIGGSVSGPSSGNFNVVLDIGVDAATVAASLAQSSTDTVTFSSINGLAAPAASSISVSEDKANGSYSFSFISSSCSNCSPTSGVGCKILPWTGTGCSGNTTKPSYVTGSAYALPTSWATANTDYNLAASNSAGIYSCTLSQTGSVFVITTPNSPSSGDGGWCSGTYSGSTYTPTADTAAAPAFYKYPWMVVLSTTDGMSYSYEAISVCAQSP